MMSERGNTKKQERGFTTFELLVTLGIFVLLVTGLSFSSRSFNSNTEFKNTVYEAALLVREAQVFGTTARESREVSGDFDTGYGIYVSSIQTDRIILFNDSKGGSTVPGEYSGDYNYSGGDDVDIEAFQLPDGVSITRFCVTRDTGTENCWPDGSNPSKLIVTFRRPSAVPYVRTNSAAPPSGPTYVSASIQISDEDGRSQTINIDETGRIHVEETTGSTTIPPTVSLSAPSNGSTYLTTDTVSMSSLASDPDDGIDRVEFLVDNVEVGQDNSEPYNYNWTGMSVGSYELKARAVDMGGLTTTSSGVTISVTSGGGNKFDIGDRVEVITYDRAWTGICTTGTSAGPHRPPNPPNPSLAQGQGTVASGPHSGNGIVCWYINFDDATEGYFHEDKLTEI